MGVTTKPSREMSASRVPVTMRDFFFDDPFFKNSWEDFDRVRDAMFTESREKWLKFDEDFRNMACMSNNIMLESSPETDKKEEVSDPRILVRQDSKSRWESGWMFPRRWMLPALNTDFPTNMELFKTKDSEVIRVKEDESKLEVSLDTSQYRPDELKVSVSDGVLVVEGKHEEKAEDGSKMWPAVSPGNTLCPPQPRLTRWPPTSPLTGSWSSRHQRRLSLSSKLSLPLQQQHFELH